MTDRTKTHLFRSSIGPQMKHAMSIIKSHVDRLFEDAPPRRGQLCENPVVGGYYVGGEDPIAPQKRMVHRALLAREWFAVYGPRDAQPLPISSTEIETRKYAWDSKHPAHSYIVSRFANSLLANNWDFNSHPSPEDFACGVMASEHTPDFVKSDEALRKRYPPHRLRHLNSANCWDPPERTRKR
jgi:hypothetical protein